MTQCPRCGDLVDRLYPIPSEALRPEVRAVAGSHEAEGSVATTRGQVCSWCLHELLEG